MKISFHPYLPQNCYWTTEKVYYLLSSFIYLLKNMHFFHYKTIHYSWHIIRILNNYSSSKMQWIRIQIALFGTNYSNIRIIWIIHPNTAQLIVNLNWLSISVDWQSQLIGNLSRLAISVSVDVKVLKSLSF